ncbi:hypothetical protein DN402_08495 [Streptomyces sp. SW4]|nr:hypothetical protein DN402_08495 [Streptomyces sp. SW4]
MSIQDGGGNRTVEREGTRMSSILIANRGEIAVRVLRAARALGLRTVAVHAPGDRSGGAARLADEAVPLTGPRPYLDAGQLVAAARRTGCALLHPGYGFLSESPHLARLCAKDGVAFVGPEPDTLAVLGDKARARELAVDLGVPVLAATRAGWTRKRPGGSWRGSGRAPP